MGFGGPSAPAPQPIPAPPPAPPSVTDANNSIAAKQQAAGISQQSQIDAASKAGRKSNVKSNLSLGQDTGLGPSKRSVLGGY
jgi:hypothetical protein